MQSIDTLKTRKQFQHLRIHGSKTHDALLLQTDDGKFFYAIAVTKKQGCAVERNRIKRRIRAALRELKEILPSQMVIFKPSRIILQMNWIELKNWIQECLIRVNE